MRYLLAVALVLFVAAEAQADPGLRLGLKTRRVGDNILLENPTIGKVGSYVPAPKGPEAPRPPVVYPSPFPESLDGYKESSVVRITKQFAPTARVIRHFSTGTGLWSPVSDNPAGTFSDKGWMAMNKVPDWLRLEFIANMSLLPAELQDQLFDLLIDVEDERYLDEIAFLIANLTPEDLTNPDFKPRFISDQAKYVYAADPLLDYVELKDYGLPGKGDYWTTAVYTYTKEGKELTYELPPYEYYWWVVATRLDGEPLFDVRPDTGKPDVYPLGLSFREYYLLTPPEADPYTRHYVFKVPPAWEKFKGLIDIPFESLNGWGPSQKGTFADLTVGPSNLTFDSQGRPTTIEFKLRPKGVMLATTLLVEKAYADGKSELLQTMLRYGAGNVVMDPTFKHLVVMDNPAPFGAEGVIEGVLDEFKVNYEVIGALDLAEADLTDVRKIIIPSDQPKELYLAVAENKQKLEEWAAADWRIIELHCAVSTPEQDWSGAVMPGNFSVAGVADQEDDTVEVEGQPPLKKLIAGTKYYWDFVPYPGLSGDRIFDPNTFALDKIGWWSSQNIWDSVIDWAEKHPWIWPDRTVQAVRVLWDHYGNCGENQDIITAASRSCLLPVSNTGNGPEDHVWSEYLIEGEWHTFQMGWADAPTDIDTPGISSGKKWGGGKNISLVTQTFADGSLGNRTDYYHYTGILDVTVVDAGDAPVPGAIVLIATETLYKEDGKYPLTMAWWDITGDDGKVALQLGANIEEPISVCKDTEVEHHCNNYYIKVLTYFGNYPEEENSVDLVLEDIKAVKDFHEAVTIKINGTLPRVKPAKVVEPADGNPERVLTVEVDLAEELACGYSLYSGTYCRHRGKGSLDFFLIDQANITPFVNGEPFDAMAAAEGVEAGFQLAIHPPAFGDWYGVVIAQGDAMYSQLADLRFRVLDRALPLDENDAEEDVMEPPVSEDAVAAADGQPAPDAGSQPPPASGSGDDSGCTAGPAPASALPLLLLVLLLVTIRRPARRPEVVGSIHARRDRRS